MEEIKLISGTANPEFAQKVSEHIGIELVHINIERFRDGECYVEITDNVRGCKPFVIQTTARTKNASGDENCMELLMILDALKRGSSKESTVVIPYYPYCRQDRKDKPRISVGAKVIADMLSGGNVERVLTMDLHAGQIQGFFNVPVDNLFASRVIVDYWNSIKCPKVTVVAPDMGAGPRTRQIAKLLDNSPIALMDKERESAGKVKAMTIVGDIANDIRGKDCWIVDDIGDSLGTLSKASTILMDNGAKSVSAFITHAILSPGRNSNEKSALENLDNSSLNKLFVTDTIPLQDNAQKHPRIEILSVAPIFANAIKEIAHNGSVSSLFK